MCKIPQDCQWPVKRLKDVKIKEKTQKLNMQLIIKYDGRIEFSETDLSSPIKESIVEVRLKPGASFTWCPSSTSPAVQEALSPSGAPVALPGGDDKDVSSASEKTPHLLHFPKKIINGEANQKPDKSTQIKHNDSRLKWMEAFETNSWSFPGFLFTLQRPGLPPGGMRRSCLSSAVATCPGATQPLQTESSGLKPLQTANGKVIVHERERRDFGPESLASRLSLWKEHCWHEEDRAGVVGPSRAT
ncbi:uncharacterized protein LOC134477434 isoform X1 [Cavia porcellus]|uniref:uncharacterized protein LOC134477434 isoform X1 n=1 Tax=Cavia porcellus TaxID=10141 RepID=UPI002FE39D91